MMEKTFLCWYLRMWGCMFYLWFYMRMLLRTCHTHSVSLVICRVSSIWNRIFGHKYINNVYILSIFTTVLNSFKQNKIKSGKTVNMHSNTVNASYVISSVLEKLITLFKDEGGCNSAVFNYIYHKMGWKCHHRQ